MCHWSPFLLSKWWKVAHLYRRIPQYCSQDLSNQALCVHDQAQQQPHLPTNPRHALFWAEETPGSQTQSQRNHPQWRLWSHEKKIQETESQKETRVTPFYERNSHQQNSGNPPQVCSIQAWVCGPQVLLQYQARAQNNQDVPEEGGVPTPMRQTRSFTGSVHGRPPTSGWECCMQKHHEGGRHPGQHHWTYGGGGKTTPLRGLEPLTTWLKAMRSSNWARVACVIWNEIFGRIFYFFQGCTLTIIMLVYWNSLRFLVIMPCR